MLVPRVKLLIPSGNSAVTRYRRTQRKKTTLRVAFNTEVNGLASTLIWQAMQTRPKQLHPRALRWLHRSAAGSSSVEMR